MKQYIKDKHKRWGYKIWGLVSEKYLFRFDIDTGRFHRKSTQSVSSVVTHLVSPYYGLNHLVVMNNLFPSIPLFLELLSHSTFALGTFRPNRKGFPSDVLRDAKNFTRGQWTFRQYDHLVTYSLMDRQLVHFLSSFHSPNQITSISRTEKNGKEITLPVPTAVRDYNSFKGGVDVLDQLHSYYSILRKSRRWWPRLAWWLIDAAILNAHRLYEIKNKEKISERDFRTMLMHELAGGCASASAADNSTSKQDESHKENGHQIVQSSTKSNCYICWNENRRRSQTYFKCLPCNKFVCVSPCYDMHRTA
jgi:hypothetical protein